MLSALWSEPVREPEEVFLVDRVQHRYHCPLDYLVFERSDSERFLDKGLQAPILVRADGARFVLVEGLHRLEAAKALGEETIAAFLVDARKH